MRSIAMNVCLYVCLYVCVSVRSHISKKRHVQTSWNFLHVLTMAVARSCSDDSVIRYVLPVLRTTSCFHVTGVGSNDLGAMLKEVVEIFNVFARGRHTVWLCHRIQCRDGNWSGHSTGAGWQSGRVRSTLGDRCVTGRPQKMQSGTRTEQDKHDRLKLTRSVFIWFNLNVVV